MEELSDITYEALSRYFTVLEKTGYVNDVDVNKLLLLQYIQQFLIDFQGYITKDDYNVIGRIIECLAGTTCLVPYLQYKQQSLPNNNYISEMYVRIAETENIRSTEPDFGLRLVNQ